MHRRGVPKYQESDHFLAWVQALVCLLTLLKCATAGFSWGEIMYMILQWVHACALNGTSLEGSKQSGRREDESLA